MANSFSSTYTHYEGGTPVDIVKEGLFTVDTAVGATAGTLLASVFGLASITSPVHFTLSDNSASYIGVPSADRTSIIVKIFSANTGVNLPNGIYTVTLRGRA